LQTRDQTFALACLHFLHQDHMRMDRSSEMPEEAALQFTEFANCRIMTTMDEVS
jgi:hypothetical protein